MNKSSGLQIARAFAVLSVVLFHIMRLSQDYASGNFYDSAIVVLKSGVDVFFVISGTVMVISYGRQATRADFTNRFIIHRFARIYPPYIIITMILALPYFFGFRYINQKHGGVDFLASFTLLPSDRLPIVPVAWTLSYEVMFYIIFAAITASRIPFIKALASWAAIVAAGYLLLTMNIFSLYDITTPYGPFIFSPFVFEFIAGCLLGLSYRSIDAKYGALAIGLAVSAFAIEAVFFHLLSTPDVIEVGRRVLLFLPPAFLLVLGLLIVPAAQASSRIKRAMVWTGSVSYSIYLIHILVVHAGYRLLWPKIPLLLQGVFFIGVFVTSVTVSAAFCYVVERPSSRFVRDTLERMWGIRRAVTARHPDNMPAVSRKP